MSADRRRKTYVGIHKDEFGGMTPTGAIVKDAWIFRLIPESETCAGWDVARMQALYEKTGEQWNVYGYQVAKLPAELRERHERIHAEAIRRARELGWQPDALVDEEDI